MKIYDETGVPVESPDLEKGWLEPQRRVIQHHPARPAAPAVTHLEVMEGTAGLRRVVTDSPAIPARPAWDEYEDVQIYHPYTPEQLAERRRPTQEERLTALEGAVLELMLGGEPVV